MVEEFGRLPEHLRPPRAGNLPLEAFKAWIDEVFEADGMEGARCEVGPSLADDLELVADYDSGIVTKKGHMYWGKVLIKRKVFGTYEYQARMIEVKRNGDQVYRAWRTQDFDPVMPKGWGEW
jgi:hypothetical protein